MFQERNHVISINKEETGVPNAGQPFNYFIYQEGGRTVLLLFLNYDLMSYHFFSTL